MECISREAHEDWWQCDNATMRQPTTDNDEIIRYLFDNWNPFTVYRLPLTLWYKVQLNLKSTECSLMAQHQQMRNSITYILEIWYIICQRQTTDRVSRYDVLNIEHSIFVYYFTFVFFCFFHFHSIESKRMLNAF